MADFEGSLPIKTVRDNDAAIKLVDGASGASATNKLTIAKPGDTITAGTNDFSVPVLGKTATGDYTHLRTEANGDAIVRIGDGTDLALVSSTGELNVEITAAQGVDGAAAPAEAIQIAGKDGAGNLQVLKTNPAGQLEVFIDDTVGTEICDYQTTATVGANSTSNHDYTITNGKTFTKMSVLVGARGATKIEVGTWDGVTFVKKATYFQQIQNNRIMQFPMFQPVGDGTLAIRIAITNLDGQSSDVYSTLQGSEV